ncbi:PTS fructose transporter subunit IIA [Anaerobacillus alkalilacustris]|uniref:PTS fructose transporter subunit IIA n=1 Tax=Anaerobacillus alkalilacustris TaxID=393763 RepID=A0A1S2LYX9_9BACI|nr:BglG family transcription antiterminator [Anaerobacillus alkalilacustris]OIJ16635.1 PTS fructose transporter subunit IIA [Anaerobacillus alkalilacustris]
MLSVRIISIFRELLAAEEPITGDYLANIIQVTSRTIRNDMKELDMLLSKHGSSIKSERGKGYVLEVHDDKLFRKMLQEMFQNEQIEPDFVPISPEDRVQFLIKQLLLKDDFMKLEDLADELFISKSTLQNDLQEVKKILKKYDLILESRPNYGFRLKGNELKRRFCMSEYLFDRSESEIDAINSKISIIPNEDMLSIKSIIINHINMHEIELSDIGINNLIIHIAIACRRIRNGNHVSLIPDELKEIVNKKEYEVAKEIVGEIEKSLNVVFPETETAYIAIHLLGTKMVVEEKISQKEIKSLMDDEIYKLVEKVLDAVEEQLRLGIKEDKELIVGLCIHLKPAINRFRYGMNLRNPMINAIKSYYPVAFQAGVVAGMVLKKEIGISIHENEIGYIALHLGGALERKKMTIRPKRCIVVCASGIGSAKLLNYKLQSRFGSKIEILGTTEYYKLKQMSLHSLDFIVSTIPISEPLSIPVIEVNTILGGQDLEKVEVMLTDAVDDTFEYTREELVFLQQKFETRDEVINFLGEKLYQLNLVGEGYLDAVYEREAVSPTCFGNLVAIPHPITSQTNSTFWAVCTLQKPVMWADKPVQFVCLLNVEKNNKSDLQKMYNILGSVVDSKQLVQQLLKCKTYQEFINIFIQKK